MDRCIGGGVFKSLENKSIALYFFVLLSCDILYLKHAMPLEWTIWGVVQVFLFFCGFSYFTRRWSGLSKRKFCFAVFFIAFIIRVVYVIFSYYYYTSKTGIPFEFFCADSLFYHNSAVLMSESSSMESVAAMLRLFSGGNFADSGYMAYLSFVYKYLWNNIIFVRCLKALYGSITCLFVYEIAQSCFGESVGRGSTIMAMLMPNLICYCGLHLKECEMIFILMAFITMAIRILHNKGGIGLLLLSVLSLLFLFSMRLSLGVVALVSFIVAAFWQKRYVYLISLCVLLSLASIFNTAMLKRYNLKDEIGEMLSQIHYARENRRQRQVANGFKVAKYATVAITAPIVTILPFSTLTDIPGHENQKLLNGGNFVRNVLGIYALWTLCHVATNKRMLRRCGLPLMVYVGYLSSVMFSAFLGSERFVLPALPFFLIFACKGLFLSLGQQREGIIYMPHAKVTDIYFVALFVMILVWNYIKLNGRGLV